MEKINIAKILKECPPGMGLDCTMYEDIVLLSADDREDVSFPIRVCRKEGNTISLTKYGQYTDADFAKCVIFPKGKTTWEGFVPPREFKDGDMIYNPGIKAISILKSNDSEKSISHVFLNILGNLLVYHYHSSDLSDWRFATKEEKQKLFDAIKASGYKWNEETKTLEKLIEPKFKVGDRIKSTMSSSLYTVVDIKDETYYIKNDGEKYPYQISSAQENLYELVADKFDITTFKPFDKVLVRDNHNEVWFANFFSHLVKNSDKPFACIGWTTLNEYSQCIPYKGNEYLCGTYTDCDEYYKNW